MNTTRHHARQPDRDTRRRPGSFGLAALVFLLLSACRLSGPAEPTEVELEWPETSPGGAPADEPARPEEPPEKSLPDPGAGG